MAFSPFPNRENSSLENEIRDISNRNEPVREGRLIESINMLSGEMNARMFRGRQKMSSHVTASCYRSLNALTEVEEPAGMGESLGTGAHRHRSILPPGVKYVPGPRVLRRILSNWS